MQTRPDTVAAKPQTLADHARAYGVLILDELNESKSLWHKRTRLQVIGFGGLGVSISLAGTGAMLWAVTPPTQMQSAWVLVAVPLAFLAIGIACLVAAAQQKLPVVLEHTRQKFMADMAVLQDTNLAAVATERFVLPMATAHPYRMVIGAAVVGALVVRAHPWRLLSGSAVLIGLLPKVLSALNNQRQPLS